MRTLFKAKQLFSKFSSSPLFHRGPETCPFVPAEGESVSFPRCFCSAVGATTVLGGVPLARHVHILPRAEEDALSAHHRPVAEAVAMPLRRGLRSQPLSPGDGPLGDCGNSRFPPWGLRSFAYRVTGLKAGVRSGVQESGAVGKSGVCPHGHKEGLGRRAEAAASPGLSGSQLGAPSPSMRGAAGVWRGSSSERSHALPS